MTGKIFQKIRPDQSGGGGSPSSRSRKKADAAGETVVQEKKEKPAGNENDVSCSITAGRKVRRFHRSKRPFAKLLLPGEGLQQRKNPVHATARLFGGLSGETAFRPGASAQREASRCRRLRVPR
jgi:hypothetical protein